MELFALLNQKDNRIQKFSLAPELQADIETLFMAQLKDFRKTYIKGILFDGNYTVNKKEYLYIKNYVDAEKMEEAIKSPMSIPEIDTKNETFELIFGLFTGFYNAEGAITLLLQNFDKRRVLSTGGFSIFHSQDLYRKIDGNGLTIDHKLVGVLENGKLDFTSHYLINKICTLKLHYIEASNKDIEDFANMPCIAKCDLENLQKISNTTTRRKISIIQKSGILNNFTMDELKETADIFKVSIVFEKDEMSTKLVLPNGTKELKDLLSFLAEDIYISALTKMRMYTNSRRPLPE